MSSKGRRRRELRCRTTLVMPDEFIVWNEPMSAPKTHADRRLDAIRERVCETPP
jgi:hypothetical protein